MVTASSASLLLALLSFFSLPILTSVLEDALYTTVSSRSHSLYAALLIGNVIDFISFVISLISGSGSEIPSFSRIC